ncbi:ribonuclease HII [PVC group bacterium (ex Bugula neritina AB1)]|nr:ribonuclease HII [PVC group bacterium (ex Bugula neritina AB1)]
MKLSVGEEDRKFSFQTKEESLYDSGCSFIAGVDEVGRGSLAGPVVAAAVILPRSYWPKGLKDSKKLSEPGREKIFEDISSHALSFATGFVSEKIIDEINIREATFLAMSLALKNLKIRPDYVLVDGKDCIKDWDGQQESIIKGDNQSRVIAAASVCAKVARDRVMVDYDKSYPGYFFVQNKGYGTKDHRSAIENMGFSAIHRKTFEPVKSYLKSSLSK